MQAATREISMEQTTDLVLFAHLAAVRWGNDAIAKTVLPVT